MTNKKKENTNIKLKIEAFLLLLIRFTLLYPLSILRSVLGMVITFSILRCNNGKA